MVLGWHACMWKAKAAIIPPLQSRVIVGASLVGGSISHEPVPVPFFQNDKGPVHVLRVTDPQGCKDGLEHAETGDQLIDCPNDIADLPESARGYQPLGRCCWLSGSSRGSRPAWSHTR
jgi:hypothetical protein